MRNPINGECGTYYRDDDGAYHRDDGPALCFNSGTKIWCHHGVNHRLDGPAVEWHDGIKSWWYYGKHIPCSSQEEFVKLLKLKAFW